MGELISSDRRPFGPCTVTSRPLMVTSTPPGTTTGSRPIRDIDLSSPDVGEDFPAHASPVRLLVGQQAARGRDDGDAKSAKHPGQVVLLRVHPQARLGHPLEPGDRPLAGRPELERDHEVLTDLGVLHLPHGDVSLLMVEQGMPTVSWYAALALRRRVSMSAIGSVIVMGWWPSSPGFPWGPSAWSVGAGRAQVGRCPCAGRARAGWLVPGGYQLDLVMPGSSPRCAIERKQIRQSPNRRYTARGRPQREHRVYPRTLNLGVRFALTTSAFFATPQLSLNGNPSRRNSERPSSSLVAVVTRVTSMPRCLSTWSGSISWNINCSFRPKV